MDQILPHPLWVGHALAGRDYAPITATSIKAIVQLAAEEPPLQAPREFISCHIPLVDGAGNRAEVLFLAVSTAATLLKLNIPVLLCCGGGASRAPAIAAAALALVSRRRPEECLQEVARHHHCDVSPGLWTEVTAILPSGAAQP